MKTSNLPTLRAIFGFAVIALVTGVSSGQENAVIWGGVYTAEQATRGETVYTETCIACHGQDLGGNSNSPGLVGMGFMFLWKEGHLALFMGKFDPRCQLIVQDICQLKTISMWLPTYCKKMHFQKAAKNCRPVLRLLTRYLSFQSPS